MPVFKQDESKFKMKSGNNPAFKMMGKESAFPLIRMGISKGVRKLFGGKNHRPKKGYYDIDRPFFGPIPPIDLSGVKKFFKGKKKSTSKKSPVSSNKSKGGHLMEKPALTKKKYY